MPNTARFVAAVLSPGISMMSPDRSSGTHGGRYPSPETLELMRAALSRYLRGEDKDEQVCEALEALAKEAQERKLNAEHMLVAFKELWAAMPEVRAIKREADERGLREHLITLCIDVYYKR